MLWDNEVIPDSAGSPRHLDDIFFFYPRLGQIRPLVFQWCMFRLSQSLWDQIKFLCTEKYANVHL